MRKDLEKFFIKLQLDYNNLNKQKEKIDEEYGKHMLDDNQYINFLNYYNNVKVNYDRVHYVMYLLRKPPVFIERLLEKLTTLNVKKDLEKFKKLNADEESILAENKENLDIINGEFIKE